MELTLFVSTIEKAQEILSNLEIIANEEVDILLNSLLSDNGSTEL